MSLSVNKCNLNEYRHNLKKHKQTGNTTKLVVEILNSIKSLNLILSKNLTLSKETITLNLIVSQQPNPRKNCIY